MADAVASDDDRNLLMQFVAQYEAPAYVRRARSVELAYESIVERCRQQRREWLAGVRLHLKWLETGTGDRLPNATKAALAALRTECELEEKAAAAPNRRQRPSLLRHLRASVARFNRRWSAFLDQFDLSEINAVRDGYNRHYLLEKECAVGSVRLAATTFRPLEPMATAELRALFPLLPMP
jgi:hypothetical protein